MIAFKRRQFLNAMMGAGAATSIGGVTSLFPSVAHAAPAFDDYKALVVLFMHGGNDAYNMTVPLGSKAGSGYDTYKASREAMAVNNVNLGQLQPPDAQWGFADGQNRYAAASNGAAYLKGVYDFGEVGINGVMPELAELLRQQKAAVVANIGTLVEPVTKATLKSAQLPPFLFAHNHQQRAMETGWADNLSAGGWAGRIADLWAAHTASGINGGSPLGLNVSYGGATRMMTATYNSPTVLTPGVTKLFRDGGFDTELFKTINSESIQDSPLRRVLKGANYKAAVLSDILADYLDPASDQPVTDFSDLSDPYGMPLFTVPDSETTGLSRLGGGLLKAAKSAARMVALGRDVLGLKRQILFIDMGGFDNHTELLQRHPVLLRELSLALWDFQLAMDSLGAGKEVTVFTMSDFGRSLGNNGDGTDHAWAGHNLVVGGDVNGGNLVGAMPDMTLGGSNDVGSKGRMIPDIAIDQYLATLCSWFGVADENMSELFPNLANFQTDATLRSAYLNGLMRPGAQVAPEPNPEPAPNPDPQPNPEPDSGLNISELISVLG